MGARVYGGVKVVLDIAKETADVFPPLKSALGELTALLKHNDVSHYSRSTKMCADFGGDKQPMVTKDDVRRLISRVKSLTISLTRPPQERHRRDRTEKPAGKVFKARMLFSVLAYDDDTGT